MSALEQQPGGDHYRKLKIQPVEFIHANGLDFISGNIIKYASRWRSKGQGEADLGKIIHYAQLLLEMEYGQSEADIDPRNPSGEGNKILNARAKAEAEAKFCQR